MLLSNKADAIDCNMACLDWNWSIYTDNKSQFLICVGLLEKYRSNANTAKTRKQDCPFCKSNKRRPLINYLRKRDLHKYHDSIYEDDECEIGNEEETKESIATSKDSNQSSQKKKNTTMTAAAAAASTSDTTSEAIKNP